MKTNIIIAGAHKAGTTSLYTYLAEHPQICGASIKETHYFAVDTLSGFKSKYSEYSDFFTTCKEKNWYLEASPEYLYGGKGIAKKIYDQVANPEIIFLLRDPVEKFFSSFNHKKKLLLIPRSYTFDDLMREYVNIDDINEIAGYDHEHTRELIAGCYINYLPHYFEIFQHNKIQVFFFEDFINNPYEVVAKICQKLGIDSSFYDSFDFKVENKSIMYKCKWLHSIMIKINNTLEPLMRRSYKLKSFLRKTYYLVNIKDKEETLSDKHKEKLRDLYSAYNKDLYKFLSDKGYTSFPTWTTTDQ